MRNKYTKTFWHRMHSVREKRLCFEAAPENAGAHEQQEDQLLGPAYDENFETMVETTEDQRAHWKNIESILDMAVRKSGDKQLKKIWESDELRKWIVAQVVQNPKDGTLTWLTQISQAHAERFERTAYSEQNEFQQINLEITRKVAALVEQMNDAVTVLQAEITKDGSAMPAGVDLEALIAAVRTLNNEEKLKNRQHGLAELVRVIESVNGDQLKVALEKSLEAEKENLGDLYDSLKTKLIAKVDDASITRIEEKKRQLLVVIQDHAKLEFSTDDRAKIEAAIDRIKTELANLDADRSIILENAFGPQTRYLRGLAGDNRESVIRASVQDDLKVNEDLFIASLKPVYNGNIDAALQTTILEKLRASYVVSDAKGKEIATALNLSVDKLKTLGEVVGLEETAMEESEHLEQDVVSKLLSELLTLGKEGFKRKYETMLTGLIKKDDETADQMLTRVHGLLIEGWDVGDESVINKYMREDLHLNDEVGYSLRRMILRARLPEDVVKFMVDGGVKLRIGDALSLSAIENLTGSTVFTSDNEQEIANTLARTPKFQANETVAIEGLRLRIEAHIRSHDTASATALKAYLNNTLLAWDAKWIDAAKKAVDEAGATPDDALLNALVGLFRGELVPRGTLTTLSNAYKEAVVKFDADGSDENRDKKIEAKKQLNDLLDLHLKLFPDIRREAAVFVTDGYSDDQETKLLNLLTTRPNDTFANAAMIKEVYTQLAEYKAALGKPEEVNARENFINYMKRYMPAGEELNRLIGLLDTSGNLTAVAAKEVADIVLDDNDHIAKDRFIEIVTFLFLERPDVAAGQSAAERQRVAEQNAVNLWNTLVNGGVILQAGGGGAEFTVPDREAFVTKLTGINVGNKAKEMHQQMHVSKIHELNFGDATKQYLNTFFGDVWQAGGSWVGYMKNFTEVLMPTEGGRMEEIIRKRDRLNDVLDALQSALDASDNSGAMISAAIADIKEMQTRAVKLRGTLSPTKNIGESIMQARFLLEANAHVITVLQAEEVWDELPDFVRQTSLWIALNKGNTPEQGIEEARKFLRAYQRAPRALSFVEDAHTDYINGGPTPDNYKAFKKKLIDFQNIAQLDGAVVDALLLAIDDHQKAMTNPPLPAIGDVVTAVQMVDGEPQPIEGQLKSIDPNNRNALDPKLVSATITTIDGTDVDVLFDLTTYQQVALQDAIDTLNVTWNDFVKLANAYEASKDPRDPTSTAYDHFFADYVNNVLSPAEQKSLLEYRRKIEVVTELEGRSNLDFAFHRHDLYVKPAALFALANARTNVTQGGVTIEGVTLTNGSFSMDKWLNDGHREFSDEPLRLIIGGPEKARNALIQAYILHEDVPYTAPDGSKRMMSASEANRIVSEVKRLLQFQSEGERPALDILEKDELFKDPLEGGFRGMLESMQDMWAGDWVDKGKVVVGMVAAVWLLKNIWKKGGESDASLFAKMGRLAIVGLPMLMVANSAYKNRTGRDLLGENLLFMSKKHRNSILEQWRRRSLEYGEDRYKVLNHPAGFAAMQELMSRDDPISIKQLSDWRNSVKDTGTGFNKYSHGAPPNLDISAIQMHMGLDATDEDAYEVAFLAYEAMCVDVAALHKIDSGDIRSRANWGNDYLVREYANGDSYTGVSSGPDGQPSMQQLIQGKQLGMLDAMLMEAQLAAMNADPDNIETALERIATLTGVGIEKLKNLYGRAKVQGEIWIEQGKEVIPQAFDDLKNWTFDTYENVETWFRVRYPYAEKVVIDNFWKTYETLKGTGISIIESSEGALKFVMEGTVNISSSVISKLKETHDYILLHDGVMGELHLLKNFEEFILATFGVDILAELSRDNAEKQIKHNIEQVASFYDGGTYSPIDGSGAYTISSAYRGKRSHSLLFVQNGTDNELTFDQAQTLIEEHMDKIATRIFGKASSELPPSQQRYVLEVLQANLFRNIANNPEIRVQVEKYNLKLREAEEELARAMEKLQEVQPAIATKVKEKNELDDDISPLLTKSAEDIKGLRDEKISDLEDVLNGRSTSVRSLKEVEEKLADPSSLGYGESIWLNIRRQGLKHDIERADTQIEELARRIEVLHVYMKVAQAIPNIADRKKHEIYDTTVVLPASELMGTVVVNGETKNLNMGKADTGTLKGAQSILIDAIEKVSRYRALEDEIEEADRDYEDLVRLVQVKNTEVKKLQAEGVSGVLISETALFTGAEKPETLTQSQNRRRVEILHEVFNEEGSLFGLPLTSVFGEAGEIAEKHIDEWILRRLENDLVYKKYIDQGKDPKATIAYERYLTHIGINETFMRSMIRGEGYGEKTSPLHLSYDEANMMDRYLQERERLVSFAQFLEIWEALDEDAREKYLP